MLDYLQGRSHAFPGPTFNLAMESIPIRRTHLNDLLIEMRDRGLVLFDLPQRKRAQDTTKVKLTTASEVRASC